MLIRTQDRKQLVPDSIGIISVEERFGEYAVMLNKPGHPDYPVLLGTYSTKESADYAFGEIYRKVAQNSNTFDMPDNERLQRELS